MFRGLRRCLNISTIERLESWIFMSSLSPFYWVFFEETVCIQDTCKIIRDLKTI